MSRASQLFGGGCWISPGPLEGDGGGVGMKSVEGLALPGDAAGGAVAEGGSVPGGETSLGTARERSARPAPQRGARRCPLQ
eukprot:772602-Pyramimonas_sp.AAC.1